MLKFAHQAFSVLQAVLQTIRLDLLWMRQFGSYESWRSAALSSGWIIEWLSLHHAVAMNIRGVVQGRFDNVGRSGWLSV